MDVVTSDASSSVRPGVARGASELSDPRTTGFIGGGGRSDGAARFDGVGGSADCAAVWSVRIRSGIRVNLAQNWPDRLIEFDSVASKVETLNLTTNCIGKQCPDTQARTVSDAAG